MRSVWGVNWPPRLGTWFIAGLTRTALLSAMAYAPVVASAIVAAPVAVIATAPNAPRNFNAVNDLRGIARAMPQFPLAGVPIPFGPWSREGTVKFIGGGGTTWIARPASRPVRRRPK